MTGLSGGGGAEESEWLAVELGDAGVDLLLVEVFSGELLDDLLAVVVGLVLGVVGCDWLEVGAGVASTSVVAPFDSDTPMLA